MLQPLFNNNHKKLLGNSNNELNSGIILNSNYNAKINKRNSYNLNYNLSLFKTLKSTNKPKPQKKLQQT